MPSWTTTVASPARGATIGFATAFILVGAATTAVKLSGGSLPLKGDEFVAGDGAPPDRFATGVGSHWNVLNWAPGLVAAAPASFAKNIVDPSGRTVQQMYVTTGANPDVGSAESVLNLSRSEDSGRSFLTTQHNSPATALTMMRRADGSLLSVDFIPEWTDATHTQIYLRVRTSKNGSTWTLHQAPVTMPADKVLGPMTNGLRVNRRPILLGDGSLILSAYTVFKGSSRQTSIVLQSSDNGLTWSLRSVIPAASTPGTNEVGWAYTLDGRLTAIMRTVNSPEAFLVQSFSDDDGRTWSESTPVLGPDGKQVHGILPDLVLQPNGTLLLLTGRPDVRVLVNYDGTAKTWNTQTTVFANYPSTGNNGRYDGTSGNNSMETVGANRAVVFYDQCHVWGCGAYNEQFGISANYVSALTPGVGRIDLMTKLLDGTATVTGTFAKKNRAFPEQRPLGAFDGSSVPGAEAVLSARKGAAPDLVVKLDRPYNLDKMGLMLGHGTQPQSATVQLSTDGGQWSAPVVTATDRTDRALEYTDFAAQTAQYVKVTGPAGVTTTVTELELYSADVDSFENETAFGIPRGWTGAKNAWVSDVPDNPAYADFGGYHSSTALRLFDKWTDDNARITRPFAATDHAKVSLQWGYQDARAKFTVSVGDASAAGWKFDIVAGATATVPQSVRAFDGTSWITLGRLSTVIPPRTYVPMSLDATDSSATLTLNGQAFTTPAKAGPATSFDGVTFSTGDPPEYGGFYLIDDVSDGDA
ncbi:MAG TPA: sialidase family protein [Jatrophihabitantaceae bacterium]|jgi:hypothetical protein